MFNTKMTLGVDVSTLDETERLGGKFKVNNKEMEAFDILEKSNVKSVRLRLWVDPFDKNGNEYGAGRCDTKTVLKLAKRAKAKNMDFMLDLHYSDFWCDPSRQLVPKAWRGFDLKQMCEAVYNYTKTTLALFKSEGVYPDIVAVGNEITGGFLWDVGKIYTDQNGNRCGFAELAHLLKSGIRAVRESGDAKVLLHLERSGDNECYREWFDQAQKNGVDFDIIGVSYYPFWHGGFDKLKANLDDIAIRYDKEIMVVETSYPFTAKHFSLRGTKLVMNDDLVMPDGGSKPFEFSVQGQSSFLESLIDTLKNVKNNKVTALYYWEPMWIPVEGATWATEAAREYIQEQHKAGGNEWANQCLFDYDGNALEALNVLAEKLL